MNSILFIYIFSLFVITSPNFIFKTPIKNHLVVVIIHAVIFSCILYFTYDIVNRDVIESAASNNGSKPDDGNVYTIDGGTTIVVDSSDKSTEPNGIQQNTVDIAKLEEEQNQTMIDAANNAVEITKSYAANAAASSASTVRSASQINAASTASQIEHAVEHATTSANSACAAAAAQTATEVAASETKTAKEAAAATAAAVTAGNNSATAAGAAAVSACVVKAKEREEEVVAATAAAQDTCTAAATQQSTDCDAKVKKTARAGYVSAAREYLYGKHGRKAPWGPYIAHKWTDDVVIKVAKENGMY